MLCYRACCPSSVDFFVLLPGKPATYLCRITFFLLNNFHSFKLLTLLIVCCWECVLKTHVIYAISVFQQIQRHWVSVGEINYSQIMCTNNPDADYRVILHNRRFELIPMCLCVYMC